MTKQILVDASLPIDLISVTYVIVQDDERKLIKTIPIKSKLLNEQVEEIIEIACKYNIPKIKVDTHGIGLGVYEYIVEGYHIKHSDRKTGDILLNSYSKLKKINTEESFEKIENYINDAIKEAVLIYSSTKQGSLQYTRALKTQVELERLKLKLIENHATLIENVVIECGEYE